MAENTCEFMEDCPTRKILTEIIEREGKANVGSTNYFIHSQSTLAWVEDEFCEHKKPGFLKEPSGEKKYTECPTYNILKKVLMNVEDERGKIKINYAHTEIDGEPGPLVTSNIIEDDPNYQDYIIIFNTFQKIMESKEKQSGKLEITIE